LLTVGQFTPGFKAQTGHAGRPPAPVKAKAAGPRGLAHSPIVGGLTEVLSQTDTISRGERIIRGRSDGYIPMEGLAGEATLDDTAQAKRPKPDRVTLRSGGRPGRDCRRAPFPSFSFLSLSLFCTYVLHLELSLRFCDSETFRPDGLVTTNRSLSAGRWAGPRWL
jgi:hypothetical protein